MNEQQTGKDDLIPRSGYRKSPSLADYEPSDQDPKFLDHLELILKKPGRLFYLINANPSAKNFIILITLSTAFLVVYGMLMGSFLGGEQFWIAPTKLVLGLFAGCIICLPSLYIFTCLNRADIGFVNVTGNLLIAVTLLSILLVGFAPVVWVFSQSTDSIPFIGFIHIEIYFISLYFSFRLLWHALNTVSGQNNGFIRVWMVIFLLVSLQMATSLRPILGTADTFLPKEKMFFINHWGYAINNSSSGGERMVR